MNNFHRFEGKVAIITGAGRGIGEVCARRLAEEGAAVTIADIDGELAERTAQKFRDSGLQAIAVKVDVTKNDEVEAMVAKTVEAFGGLNILANNAGILGRKALAEMEESEWERMYFINVKGPFLCAKAAIPYLKQRDKSKIVNIASVAAIIPRMNQTHYCGSKAALIQMSKVLALELASSKITVNVLCPGMTGTEMIASTWKSDPESYNRWLATVPIGKMGEPEDHANLLAFLCSSEADHITGQVISVDGGQTINFAHGFGDKVFTISLN